MKIIGGAYTERCENPTRSSLAGSGVRAAAALAGVAPDIELHTAWHHQERLAAEITLNALNVERVHNAGRTRPVGFSYLTPMSAPSIGGVGGRLEDTIDVDAPDDVVLVFGMVESGGIRARGRRVILDPQRPRGLSLDDLPDVRPSDDTGQIAWTLNEREAVQLSPAPTVEESARQLITHGRADVVVVKRGARGALVTTSDEQITVDAYRTNRVYNIGSGDVFAAAFAWAWGVEEHDPVKAAQIASAAAAYWCQSEQYPLPEDVLRGNSRFPPVPTDHIAQVYLAGPFFNLQQRWLVDLARWALAPNVWSPLHEVGPGGNEVAQQDLDGLDQCDAVLALLDDDDPGTLFEVGYATAIGLPVVAYTERSNPEGLKMLIGTGAAVVDDISTAVYQAVWAAAEHRNARTAHPEVQAAGTTGTTRARQGTNLAGPQPTTVATQDPP